MMGDFNLSHLIAKLQQPSGSTQETVATWRQVLCQVVCDLVSKHARLNTAQAGGDVVHDLQVELDLVLHTVSACPQLYAPSLLASPDDTPALSASAPTELGQQEKHSEALISWLLSHLVSILGSGKCEEICVKVHEVILSLLHTVKARDPHPFYNIMVTVIGYLGELSLVHAEFYVEGAQDFTAELHWFPLEEDMVAEFGLPSAVIAMKEPEECERLQAAISKLFTDLTVDLGQFCWSAIARADADKPQMLWATIGQQLQNGDLQLKLVTLELASHLLKVGDLPCAPVTDYLFACLAALLGLLAAGYEDSEGDYVELEASLGRCVECAVTALSRPVHHLDAGAMAQSLLDKMTQVVVSHGLDKLRSPQLKARTCNAIWQLYQLLPESARSHQVALDQRQELARHLVQVLGAHDDVQHVTRCLVYLLLMEQQQIVNNNNNSILAAGDDKAAETEDESNEPGRSKVRKRKLSSKASRAASLAEGDPSMLLPHLLTLTLLFNKLTQVCQALTAASVEGKDKSARAFLSGLAAVIQVTSWCTAWAPAMPEGERPLPRTQSSRTPSKRQASVSSVNVPLTCLRADHLQQVCEAWLNWLQLCSERPALLQEGYQHVVAAIGNLVAIQDLSSYAPDVLQTFTWMLSLHWLPTEVSWLDLKPKDAKEVARISSVLADKIDEALLCDCIQLLALLPKEVATKWRSHVINAAMGDHRESIKAAAVQSFPQLLHHAGPNANHLVYDVLHPVLQSTSHEMKLAVANIVGPLACVVSRRTALNRPQQSWLGNGPLSFKAFKVMCSVCDGKPCPQEQALNKSDESWDRPKFVDPNMFLPFLSLLEDSSAEAGNIKLAFAKSLGRVFGHIGVRSSQGGQNSSVSLAQSCLGLLQDPDVRVRRALSGVVSLLLSSDGQDEGLTPMDDLVLSHLHTAIKLANEASDAALIETLLATVGHIGRVAEGDLFVSCVYSLMGSMCAPCCPLAAAVAIRQLKLMARHRNVKLRHLFLQHARSICKFLVECLHEAQRKHIQEPARVLQEVAQVFQFDDVKSFLRRTEQYLLPHLVKKATNTASSLIRFLAKQMGDPNHKVPIARNISHIYCHLVCSCQNEELLRTFTFLEDESGWELEMLLKIGQNVDSELLLHLASHYDKVLRGIKILASKTGPFKGSDDEITDENLGEMLQPKLLGILVHFDNHLNNATIPLNEKKEAYESVVSLISLMGPRNITTVRMRLMTTLRIGLRFQDRGFPELCCKAWNCYVRSLELSAVGPMLSQIILNLQPLLSKQPKQVATIYYYLLVENRRELSSHYHELYFLPDIPELAEVNAVLKQFLQSPDNQRDLRLHIRQLMKGIRHESTYVRQMALTKLKHQLHGNQADLHKLIMAHETADACISELVHVLLAGCRESDPTVRSLYGECLGELGAIDPGRLDLLSNRPKEEIKKFQASVTEENFVFDLVNELAKAFLRAEDRNTQDCVAFSLQELIQIFSIRQVSEPPSSSGSKLWARFSADVQEILGPLTHSKYKLTMTTDWSQVPRPIYRSKKGGKFEQWVSAFTGYLTSKVKEDRARQVFASCRGIVKNDSHIALYLLPHVTVQVLIDGDEQDQEQIGAEILAVLNHVRERDGRPGVTSDLRHLSAQTVFSVLDHLLKWQRHRVHVFTLRVRAAGVAKGGRAPTPVDCKYSEDPWYQKIASFLARIPQDLLAYASDNCEAYTRALMHLEQFLRPQTEALQRHLDFLQKLYVAMDEPDGVAGVTAIKQSQPTLGQHILAYESIGQLSDASVCYDRALQLAPNDLGLRQGLLRCRLQLGELDSAMELANGMIAERPGWGSSLNVYRVEAAWKLGQWERLSTYLTHEENNRHWNLGLARLLLAAKNRDECEFVEQMGMLRNDLMGPLSAASMEVGSYHRGYDYITRLHLLTEIEQGVTTLLGMSAGENSQHSQASDTAHTAESLLKLWENRLDFTQSSYRTQEPLLNMRRTLLGLGQADSESGLDKEVGQCWLKTAKVARKCGLIQTAHSSLLSASVHNLPDFCLENAKWLWDRSDFDKAQNCLEKAIEEHYPDRDRLRQEPGPISSERRACAQVLLQLAKYCEETASWESNVIMRQYKEATRINPHWEDGYFYIAKYYDKIMTTLIANDRPDKKGEFILHVVQNFGQSLLYGNQYIYQSMPRLLTLWLDYGAEVVDCEKRGRNEVALQGKRAVLGKLNQNIGLCTARLPPFQFLTAFPQLISRICHTHDDVFAQLKELIAKLLVSFPQQCVWMMMAVSKSSYPMRVKRCQDIYARAKLLSGKLNKFLLDATKLTDRLLELCNKPVEPMIPTLSIAQHFKPLQRLLDDSNFSEILLPLQTLMTVTLPSSAEVSSSHDPFPDDAVYIKGIEDVVEVLPSLQRPKKITLRGSDGKLYIMLCKPKDDLRKDARLMEFNQIVNKSLRKDPESRRRELQIRTYTVTPLNEECGMLEWVTHTCSLRAILLNLYREKGMITTGKELRTMQVPTNASIEKKLDVFRKQLLPRHPAIFSDWFLRTFPDPTSWYTARLSYCRTAAVMSMVGYILGLGDRHGENILLDSTTGDCVHVDFNCLFNKGETFDYPEIVPFRLTHNMVDAMGPMGIEGVFRRACEVTLRVMRDECDPLMSVLRTFVYDPLVEWSKPARGRSNPTDTGEVKNEKAFTHVQNIESRLKGILKNKTKPLGLPLSVEGQCNHLIKEATNENNLSQMYIGWAAYL